MTKARIISFLMVVCLATTCMLSGTVAKYTTSDSATDSATVGKWGVTLGIDGSLFAKNYKTTDNTPTNETTGISVEASGSSDLVAPGTKNENGMTITLTGTPEVSTAIKIEASGTDVALNAGTYATFKSVGKLVAFEVGKTYYTFESNSYKLVSASEPTYGVEYFVVNKTITLADPYNPVVYTLTSGTVTGEMTAAQLATVLNQTIQQNPNSNLADAVIEYDLNGDGSKEQIKLNGAKITWAWEFGTGDEKDVADTILGDLAYGNVSISCYKLVGTDYVQVTDSDCDLGTSFNITITVDQVD